jgi:methionine synthase II (cobalamin-independent)
MDKISCLTTAIGSLPHKDIKKACQIVLNNLPEVPIWPQLPQRSFKENMYIQYSENLPCIVCDDKNKRIFFDTSKDLELQLERFYQRYLDKDIDYFKISKDYSAGFYAIIRAQSSLTPKFIKGHITGPISFGLTITDENKKAIIYHEQLFDAVVKGLAMKAVWQVSKFKELNLPAIIFIDEPYLSAFGSAYVNLSKNEVITYLNEVIETIKQNNNVLVGTHCCGNTDWSLLMETNVDIISFDAYDFISNFALYPQQLIAFLNRGGILAWGIIPSSNKVVNEDVNSLLKRFEEGIELLYSKGIPKELLLKNLFITPSCGTGSLSEDIAERIFRLALEFTNQLKEG